MIRQMYLAASSDRRDSGKSEGNPDPTIVDLLLGVGWGGSDLVGGNGHLR